METQYGIFITESGLLPLPENAVELEKDFSIPSRYFRAVQKITHDPSGNIYVSDIYKSAVFKFQSSGEYVSQLGRQGKGKFLKPDNIFATHNALYIQDLEKETIECMDLDGNYQKSLKISHLSDFIFDQNGDLYVAPTVKDKNTPLIQVYSFKKNSIRSFGKAIHYRHSIDILNSRTLAINSKGELWVAFTYFPIVRKYSKEGKLISEFKVKNLIMEAKEKFNLKKIGKGITRPAQRVGYMEVIVDIEAYGDKIYLLSHYPRLEITEIHEDGKIGKTYWKEFQEVYKIKGFVIQGIERKLRFFILHSNVPNDSVDVFKEMEKAALSPFQRTVKKYTETIKINPDYWRAYHNRALVKYRYKDFEGAVDDFTKVIELNPKSASAYYNRGNCQVNLSRYNEAIKDYNKSIEINPEQANAYYNRGIALMHKKDFDEAIKDLKKTAQLDPNLREKAWQKIRYCLTYK